MSGAQTQGAQAATGLLKLPGLRPLMEESPKYPKCTDPRQAEKPWPPPQPQAGGQAGRLATVLAGVQACGTPPSGCPVGLQMELPLQSPDC